MMVLIIFLYALFASTFSLGKVLLQFGPPIFLVGMRMVIAGFLLLTYQYFYAGHHFKFKKKHISLYIQSMIFSIYLPYILRYWGLQFMPSSKACLLYNLGPFLSYLLSYLLEKETVTKGKIFGLTIGFFSMLPILIAAAPGEDLLGSLAFISLPELAIIISVSSLSYGWIILRKLINDKDYAPPMVNGITMFTGGTLALLTSVLVESQQPITDPVYFSIILGIIIVVSNIFGHNLYGTLLKTYSPTFLSFASFLTPIFAATYGWILLNEGITWHFYVSTIGVSIGLALFYKDEINLSKQA